MESPASVRIGLVEVAPLVADITGLPHPVDAIVSSDDNLLSHGGGVSAAIWRAAGRSLREFIDAHPPSLGIADVFRTPAGDLQAKHILHAITIDLHNNRVLRPGDAVALYGRVLDAAAALGCHSLATPLLGTGVAGLPALASARAFARALAERVAVAGPLHRVIVVNTEPLPSAVRAAFLDIAQAGTGGASMQAVADLSARPRTALDAALEFDRLVRLRLAEAQKQAGVSPRVAARGGSRGSALRESGESLGLGAALERLLRLRVEVGRPLTASETAILQAALAARNRLAHNPGVGDSQVADAALALARGLEVLGALPSGEGASGAPPGGQRPGASRPLSTLPPAVTGSPPAVDALAETPARPGRDAATAAGGEPQSAPKPGASEARHPPRKSRGSIDARARNSPATWYAASLEAAPGTDHVRRLHHFLRDTLDAESRAEILRDLRSRGYRGDDDVCLLEHCVSAEDLQSFIANHYTSARLRREIVRLGGPDLPVSADTRFAARRLLDLMGFPPAQPAMGLSHVLGELRRRRGEVLLADATRLTGIVTQCAQLLERALGLLIRFLSIAAFRKPPEVQLADSGLLEKGRTLRKASLGTLLACLARISRDLQESSDPEVQAFRADFATSALVTAGAHTIPAMRNAFAHFDRDQGREAPPDLRRHAETFFSESVALLESLAAPEGRVFPRVLLVTEVRWDSWGRRIIEAKNDEGEQERLFTDQLLMPGEVYLMHATSNPLRVDPILVSAGDVEDPGSITGS